MQHSLPSPSENDSAQLSIVPRLRNPVSDFLNGKQIQVLLDINGNLVGGGMNNTEESPEAVSCQTGSLRRSFFVEKRLAKC